MNLSDALQQTGCAIFVNGECTTSVERLPDEQYLLMTRRGVSILQCMQVTLDELDIRYDRHYVVREWTPARVQFIPAGQQAITLPANATYDVTAKWWE